MMPLLSVSFGYTVWAFTLLVSSLLCLYTYRLTLHPLAKFPGPKLAAATGWYDFYYNVVLQGQFTFQIQKLHKKYGPIIRISPEELHVDDPDFFEILYAKSGRLDRYARESVRFGNPGSVFVTAPESLHRMRRSSLSPFFSKRNIASFQHIVQDKVGQMLEHIAKYRGTGKALTISSAYMALTGDIIMEYCFGHNFNHVDSEGFQTNFHEVIKKASQSGHLAVHFPIIMNILLGLPAWFVEMGEPLFGLLFRLQNSVHRDVVELKRQEETGDIKTDINRPNIIRDLIRSDLPSEEKADRRLQDEGQNMIGAGVSTTGWSLSVATFHIINNRSVSKRLREELEAAIPDPTAKDALEWIKLERCEYLTACIKEGIRLAYAVSSRTPRLSNNVIQYEQWQIPPRTPVSMTLVDLYHNEDIFPDSRTYRPERWLGQSETKHGLPLEKYWFGFMKGSRSCLGINLAWLELYSTLAGVFRNFEFDLFETDESDVVLRHDFVVPSPKLDSRGIQVLVRD